MDIWPMKPDVEVKRKLLNGRHSEYKKTDMFFLIWGSAFAYLLLLNVKFIVKDCLYRVGTVTLCIR